MKRRIYAAFIFMLLAAFCIASSASADLLYTRQDQSYANTALGIIQGDGAPVSPLVSNLGGNQGQGIYQFTDGNGESRVAVSLYTSGGASDVINIYNPDASSNWAEASAWNAPVEVTTSLLNIRRIVSSGSYLYGISYDNYSVNRMAASGDGYAEDKTDSYTEAGKDTHGEALVAYNRNLYAIFSVASGNVWTNGTYLANKLVKFDEELNRVQTVEMKGKNLDGGAAGAYTLSGNKLYVATLGGVQQFNTNWNPESSIEIVNLDDMTITQPVTAQAMNAKDPTFKHMFKAVVTAGDKVYVQATRWASEDEYKPGYSVRIYETTENALASGDLGKVIKEFTGNIGWSSSMLYDEENKAIWCGIGYDLWRYDGSAWKQYDQNALGGIISAFAAVTKEPTWANFADTSWYDGENAASGSSSDPYVMTTAEQLAGLAQLLKNKESTFEGSYFVLDSDIDLQNREWLPIGRFLNNFNNYGFAGDFDGRGHSIKGLLVTKVSNVLGETDMRTECPALFGYLDSKGSIRNLYVEGVVKGNKAQGASVLVTWNTGTIDNCVVSGDVTAEGAYRSFAGGISGVANGGVISNCVSYGRYITVPTGIMRYAAGFVGYASQAARSTFLNCVGLAEKANAGISQGMIGATAENCYYLQGDGSDGRPTSPGTASAAIGISSESKAPVSSVLLDSESLKKAGTIGEDYVVRLAAYPRLSPTEGVLCAWSFDGDVQVVSTDGLTATINASTAGEKYFTATITGINGIEAEDTENAIVLRGKVQINEKARVVDPDPSDPDPETLDPDPSDPDPTPAPSHGGGGGGCNGGFGALALLSLVFVPFAAKRVKK